MKAFERVFHNLPNEGRSFLITSFFMPPQSRELITGLTSKGRLLDGSSYEEVRQKKESESASMPISSLNLSLFLGLL